MSICYDSGLYYTLWRRVFKVRLPSTRSMTKLLAGVLLAVITLAVALGFVARTDWFLGEARAKLEEGLGRKIAFSSFSPSFFPSIGVRAGNFILYERDGTTPCLQSKDIIVRVRILPLLWRSVSVSTVYVDQPRVSLVRGKDGTWNFETLFKKEKPAAELRAGAAAPPAKKREVQFSIASLRVKNGLVTVSEPSLGSPLLVKALNLKARGISKGSLPYIDGSGRIEGAPLSDLTGGVKELARLNLRGGTVSGSVSVRGWVDKRVAFQTRLDVKGVGFSYKNVYQTPEPGLDLRVGAEGGGSYREKVWDVRNVSAELLGGQLAMTGMASGLGRKTDYGVEIRGRGFPWRGLGTLRVPRLTMDGAADLDAGVTGTKEDMRVDVSLNCARSRLGYGAGIVKPEGMPASLILPLRISGSAVRWENASVRLADLALVSQGSLSRGTSRALTARMSGTKLSLASVGKMFDWKIVMKGDGALDIGVEHMLGLPLSAASVSGKATVTGGEVRLPRLAHPLTFDLTGACTPGNLRLGVNTARLGSSLAEGYASFDMKRWPVFECDMNFPVMDSADFSPPARPPGKSAALDLLSFAREAAAAVPPIEEKGLLLPPFVRKLEGGGRVTVGELRLGKLRARQGQGRLAVRNGVASLNDISLPFYGGETKGIAVADLSTGTQRYRLDGSMTGVDLASLLADVYRYADAVSGKLSAEVAAGAEGRDWTGVKEAFSAKGRFSVAEGRLRSFSVMREIGPLFSLLGQEARCKEFTAIGDLLKNAPEETKLSRCEGSFVLQGTRWGTGDLILEITEGNIPMRLKLDGDMGVDGLLNLTGRASVPRGSALYSQLEPYFPDDNGWIAVPFPIPIGGTLGSPRVDVVAARESVVKCAAAIASLRLRKEIEKKIDRELEGKPKKSGESPTARDVGRELLKDASKEMLKKVLQ